jgi:CRISPR-associated protein Cas5d
MSFTLEVWGDFACFTIPPMGKVERFSYPVITPSAARSIFDAIYWKPYFRWQVTRVEVLEMPRYIGLMRNEVKDKAPGEKTITSWAEGRSEPEPLWADGNKESLGTDQKGRTQRQTMALRNVRYRITAHLHLWKPDHELLRKIEGCFERRARAGQCVNQPYLGCREFAAYFQLAESEEKELPVDFNEKIGIMLYDVFDLSRPGAKTDASFISVFDAEVKHGVLDVPTYDDDRVLKPIRVAGEQPCLTF